MSEDTKNIAFVKTHIDSLRCNHWSFARSQAYRETREPYFQTNEQLARKVSELLGRDISRESLYYYWRSNSLPDDLAQALWSLLGQYLTPFLPE